MSTQRNTTQTPTAASEQPAEAQRPEDAQPLISATERPNATERPSGPRLQGRGPLAMLALAVVILGGGVIMTVAGAHTRAPAANQALVDAAATRQVIATVSQEVSAVFSYSYANIGATSSAAATDLAGPAARQYRMLFSQVVGHGPAEKLTLTSQVSHAGVVSLANGSAELLLFLDQKWQRGTAAPVTAAAQLDVSAQLIGGRWRITAIGAR